MHLGGYPAGHPGGRVGPEALADALGTTLEELHHAAQEGRTPAEIAESEGVRQDDLVERLVAAAEGKLDELVAEGRLTEAEADELRGDLTERVTARVDEPLGRAFGGHDGHGWGSRHGDTGEGTPEGTGAVV